jgi:hypothetical protein
MNSVQTVAKIFPSPRGRRTIGTHRSNPVMPACRFVIHTSVHQPLVDKGPGLGLGPFGQWFTRNETVMWGRASALQIGTREQA